MEVIVHGLRQGYKRPAVNSGPVPAKARSRICKQSLLDLFLECVDLAVASCGGDDDDERRSSLPDTLR